MSDGFRGSGPPWRQEPPWHRDPGDPGEPGLPGGEGFGSDVPGVPDEAGAAGTADTDGALGADGFLGAEGANGFLGAEGLEATEVDEAALRRMLQGAVDDLEPTPGTLEYLQRAVPARRARRRQILVGAAATVILVGASVPALMTVADTGDENGRRSSAIDSDDPGGDRRGGSSEAGEDTAGTSEEPGVSGGGDEATEGQSPGPGEKSADPTDSPATRAPACTPAQFGEPASSKGEPDAAGRVKGAFTVSNVSDTACTVDSPGEVRVGTLGAASVGDIDTRTHESGDGATDLLPEPEQASVPLLLEPGSSYMVKFAWVPEKTGSQDGGCTAEGSSSPSPEPTGDTAMAPMSVTDPAQPETMAEDGTGGTGTEGGTGGTGETDGGGADGGTGGGSGGEEPEDPPAEGAVTLTHTPEAGSAVASSVTVPNACAGTVYLTEPMPS